MGGNAAWREGSQLEHPKKPTARVNSEAAVRCTDLDAKKAKSDGLGLPLHVIYVKKIKKEIPDQGGESKARKGGVTCSHMRFSQCLNSKKLLRKLQSKALTSPLT